MVAIASAALLLSSTIGAVATPILDTRSTFTIPAIRNKNYVRNGTAALLKAYAKYNLKPTQPDSVLGRRQDGSVAATPAAQDVEYLCPVSIGGEILNLNFDTGSSDL
jgi:hypothetical protein